jgi:hypothetical protein
MSDVQRLEQKIDLLHERHIDSTVRMEASIEKMSESVQTFVAFQARAEERHASNNARLDKVETKLERLWDMVHKNSLIVNAALGITGLIVGGFITWFFRGL